MHVFVCEYVCVCHEDKERTGYEVWLLLVTHIRVCEKSCLRVRVCE
jgi:hypothetical protein